MPPPSSTASSSKVLLRIAAALDLPIDAFKRGEKRYVLHTAADGATWHLLHDAQGNLVVRHTRSAEEGDVVADRSVADFLSRDLDSPQRKALAALIDRLLTVHLLG